MSDYVRSGEPFRPSASTWNKFVEMEKNQSADAQVDGGKGLSRGLQVMAKMNADTPRLTPINVDGAAIDPDSALFSRTPVFQGVAAEPGEPFFLTLDEIKAGTVGRVLAVGPVVVPIKVTGESHLFVKVGDDNVTLETAAEGNAAIVWRDEPDMSDMAQALINLGVAGVAAGAGVFQAQIKDVVDDDPGLDKPYIYTADIYEGNWDDSEDLQPPAFEDVDVWSRHVMQQEVGGVIEARKGDVIAVFPVGDHWEVVPGMGPPEQAGIYSGMTNTGVETAHSDDWVFGPDGKVLTVCCRMFYDGDSDGKLYSFSRKITFDRFGRVYSIGPEVRDAVAETVPYSALH